MRRREFISLLGAAIVWPLLAPAQRDLEIVLLFGKSYT
jgi:hypothetical protein